MPTEVVYYTTNTHKERQMKTLIAATLYTCLNLNGSNVCQYKEVQLDKNICKNGIIEQTLPKGSEVSKIKVATICKG